MASALTRLSGSSPLLYRPKATRRGTSDLASRQNQTEDSARLTLAHPAYRLVHIEQPSPACEGFAEIAKSAILAWGLGMGMGHRDWGRLGFADHMVMRHDRPNELLTRSTGTLPGDRQASRPGRAGLWPDEDHLPLGPRAGLGWRATTRWPLLCTAMNLKRMAMLCPPLPASRGQSLSRPSARPSGRVRR